MEGLSVWDIYNSLFIQIYLYLPLCFFNPGVEGLPVWDKPVGGRHVSTGSLKEEEEETTPEKYQQTLKKNTPEKYQQTLTKKTFKKEQNINKETSSTNGLMITNSVSQRKERGNTRKERTKQ